MATNEQGERAGGERSTDGPVVVPTPGGEVDPATVTFAAGVAAGRGSEVVVVNPRSVPEQTPPGLADTATAKREAAAVVARVDDAPAPVRATVVTGHGTRRCVASAVRSTDAGLVVADLDRQRFRHGLGEWTARTTGVDAVSVADPPPDSRAVLVPVAGGPHSSLAVSVAGAFAASVDAHVELLHVVAPDAGDGRHTDGRELLTAARGRLPDGVGADTWLLEADDVAAAIREQSQYYGLTLLGAPRRGRLRRLVSPSPTDDVRGAVESVGVVRRAPRRRRPWFSR